MNLTKEQVRKLKQACETINSTLEKIDTPTVEEGQYWRNSLNSVFRIQEVKDGEAVVRYITKDTNGKAIKRLIPKTATLLSDDEVDQALKEEAIRRGYDYHNFECMVFSGWDNADQGGYEYHSDVDVLYLGCNACYCGGDWAEILEDEWEIKEPGLHRYLEKGNAHIKKMEDGEFKVMRKQEAEAIAKALNDL